MNGRCRPAGVQAFSLVELMIAACIMAIVFASLFAGISTTFSLMDVTRENLRGTQIMVSRLEGLRLCAWSNGQLFNTNVVPPNYTESFYPLGLNSSTNVGTIYTGTLIVTTNFALNPPATYSNKLAKVTIAIAWVSSHGSATNVHQRSMITYVAQYGMQNYTYAH
ncbi:MAG: hypothetical protein PHY43_04850 [Verrucomicrobiales bacterium]|nr:hypothetical protein [Verrucomicrobiales bacterium]